MVAKSKYRELASRPQGPRRPLFQFSEQPVDLVGAIHGFELARGIQSGRLDLPNRGGFRLIDLRFGAFEQGLVTEFDGRCDAGPLGELARGGVARSEDRL